MRLLAAGFSQVVICLLTFIRDQEVEWWFLSFSCLRSSSPDLRCVYFTEIKWESVDMELKTQDIAPQIRCRYTQEIVLHLSY